MYLKELLELPNFKFEHLIIYDYHKYLYYQKEIEEDKNLSLLKDCVLVKFDFDISYLKDSISNLFYKRVEDVFICCINDDELVCEVYLCFG